MEHSIYATTEDDDGDDEFRYRLAVRPSVHVAFSDFNSQPGQINNTAMWVSPRPATRATLHTSLGHSKHPTGPAQAFNSTRDTDNKPRQTRDDNLPELHETTHVEVMF